MQVSVTNVVFFIILLFPLLPPLPLCTFGQEGRTWCETNGFAKVQVAPNDRNIFIFPPRSSMSHSTHSRSLLSSGNCPFYDRNLSHRTLLSKWVEQIHSKLSQYISIYWTIGDNNQLQYRTPTTFELLHSRPSECAKCRDAVAEKNHHSAVLRLRLCPREQLERI